MAHIKVIDDAPDARDEAYRGLRLGMSPDALEMPKVDEYVDLVAGYEVMRVAASQHDGVPATLITLGDSTGNREVGILRVRNDAVREAELEVLRLFEDGEARDRFLESLAQPKGSDEVKQLELDVALEHDGESLLDVLVDMTEGTKIAFRIVTMNGPGGGNPVVEFIGKDRELRKMLVEKYGAGEYGEPVEFYMGD